jgi:5-methylcytosine-specific restriction endonuclease McrA
MTDDIITKFCPKCSRNLPASAFSKSKRDGLQSQCRACKKANYIANREKRNEQSRANYAANREKRKEQMKVYQKSNPEIGKASNARYRAKNRDKILVKGKEYREKNRLRLREEARERYASDREKYQSRNKAWKKANPDKLKAQDFRRRARMSGGTLTASEIKAIVAQDCFWCGTDCAQDYHLDHIVPLSKGGRNSRCNIAVSCPSCNLQKGSKDLSDWLSEIGWR